MVLTIQERSQEVLFQLSYEVCEGFELAGGDLFYFVLGEAADGDEVLLYLPCVVYQGLLYEYLLLELLVAVSLISTIGNRLFLFQFFVLLLDRWFVLFLKGEFVSLQLVDFVSRLEFD